MKLTRQPTPRATWLLAWRIVRTIGREAPVHAGPGDGTPERRPRRGDPDLDRRHRFPIREATLTVPPALRPYAEGARDALFWRESLAHRPWWSGRAQLRRLRARWRREAALERSARAAS